MKVVVLSAMLGIAVAGCGEDDGDERETSSATDGRDASSATDGRTVSDAGPSGPCKVPTGTFLFTSMVTGETGAGCSVTSSTLSASIDLAGSLENFLSPSCKGTATWLPGSACVIRAQETCSSGDTTRELTVSSDGNTLRGTQTQRAGRCEVQASLSGTRTTSTSAPTTTPPAVNTSTRLDVQLLYEDGVPVGQEGGYLEYIRYRLYPNGTFASCKYQLAFGPGVVSGKPAERNRGSYEIVGTALKLRDASGASTNVPFTYSAAQGQARIDGKEYFEEKPADASDLCDFGV